MENVFVKATKFESVLEAFWISFVFEIIQNQGYKDFYSYAFRKSSIIILHYLYDYPGINKVFKVLFAAFKYTIKPISKVP